MRVLTATTFLLFAATSAFGQQAPGTDSTSQTKPTVTSPAVPAPNANTSAPSPNTPSAVSVSPAAPSEGNHFLTGQTQDQWLVGNLWNKRVYNASGEAIGDLKDVLVDRDGHVAGVVIGVGGFLGLGEKNVAVDYNYLKQNGSISGDRVVVGMSAQDLRSAPDFQRIKPVSSMNSGAGTSGNTNRQ